MKIHLTSDTSQMNLVRSTTCGVVYQNLMNHMRVGKFLDNRYGKFLDNLTSKIHGNYSRNQSGIPTQHLVALGLLRQSD